MSQQLRRCVAQEERQEEENRPPHDQIDGQAHGRERTPRERLVEYPEEHHRPLQHGDEHALPPADDREGNRGVAAGDGHVDEDVVQDVEDRLVLRGGIHRVVERRGEEHEEERDDEDAHRNAGQHRLRVVQIGPHRREGEGAERQKRHHAVGDGIGNLLTQRGKINSIVDAQHGFQRVCCGQK